MPRRRRRRGGRRGRFGRFVRGTKSALGVALSALAVANATKRLINVEYKNCRKTYNDEDITSVGSIAYLNPIGQGDDSDDRNGNSIRAKSILARLRITFTAGGDATQWIRIMLFQDLQNAGTVPTIAELLDTTDVSSPRNLENTRRFKTIWDKTITLTAEKGGRILNIYKKLNSVVRFIDTDDTQASAGNGTYYMLTLSEQVAGNYPTIDGVIRFRFIDN